MARSNLASLALAYSFYSLFAITSSTPIGEEMRSGNGGRGISQTQTKIGQVNIGLLTHIPTVLDSQSQLDFVNVDISSDSTGEATFPPTDLVGAVISKTSHDAVRCSFHLADQSTDETWFVDSKAKKTFLPPAKIEGVSRIACSLTTASSSTEGGIRPVDDFGIPNIVPDEFLDEQTQQDAQASESDTTFNPIPMPQRQPQRQHQQQPQRQHQQHVQQDNTNRVISQAGPERLPDAPSSSTSPPTFQNPESSSSSSSSSPPDPETELNSVTYIIPQGIAGKSSFVVPLTQHDDGTRSGHTFFNYRLAPVRIQQGLWYSGPANVACALIPKGRMTAFAARDEGFNVDGSIQRKGEPLPEPVEATGVQCVTA